MLPGAVLELAADLLLQATLSSFPRKENRARGRVLKSNRPRYRESNGRG